MGRKGVTLTVKDQYIEKFRFEMFLTWASN